MSYLVHESVEAFGANALAAGLQELRPLRLSDLYARPSAPHGSRRDAVDQRITLTVGGRKLHHSSCKFRPARRSRLRPLDVSAKVLRHTLIELAEPTLLPLRN